MADYNKNIAIKILFYKLDRIKQKCIEKEREKEKENKFYIFI